MQAYPQRALTRTDGSALTPDDLAAAAVMLERVEGSRREQLAALAAPDDAVAREHRASVQRILDAICVARAQVAAETYGACAECGSALDGACLRARPWAVWCAACAHR